MNKNAIKKFAIDARNELIARVSSRAEYFGITEKKSVNANADNINGRVLSPVEKSQRQALLASIAAKGYQQVMEEVAYTWFNRFSALRFMEANGYLPSRVRVFTNDNDEFKPQILDEAINLDWDGLDMGKVYDLKNANDDNTLFNYLINIQCHNLSDILPGIFQVIREEEDYFSLLFPEHLLFPDSVLDKMIAAIPEEDWKDQVQIIGWLYQYYNSEPKDKVFANLKKNIKISKENIPAATQLFTPDWIVRYMVENSLGRLWVERVVSEQWSVGSEQERIELEKRVAEEMGWKYYLPEAEQEPTVREQLNRIASDHCSLTPEHYKIIDPCMGSGHILVYAFDVLVQIYESYGYSVREAVKSIVENNLWGLDIDQRAAQLAYFAVMMKARQHDRRFFSRHVQPHVYAIEESNAQEAQVLDYFYNGNSAVKAAMETLRAELRDAKEYGSILNVSMVDFAALYARFEEIEDDISLYKDSAMELLPFVQCAEAMAQKYHVVVTNPPYMGAGGMGEKLSDYVKKNYPDSKSDMSTVCMERASSMCAKNGYWTMINIPVWMFISSYEKLRYKLLANQTIINMVHPGRGIFGSDFGTTTFVFAKRKALDYSAKYRRLFKNSGDVETIERKEQLFSSGIGEYIFHQKDFSVIPSSPIAYWASDDMLNIFKSGEQINKYAEGRKGLVTGNDNVYLKLWFEVATDNFSMFSGFENTKWKPCNKGGSFRKWYGNNEYVVNWGNDGSELANHRWEDGRQRSSLRNSSYFFKKALTWTYITSGTKCFRFYPEGFAFAGTGPCLYPKKEDDILYLLAYSNSVVFDRLLKLIGSSTISLESGEVERAPFINNRENDNRINPLTQNCISLSKTDWDAFETSWDFQRHPLVSGQLSVSSDQCGESETDHCSLLTDHYSRWETECNTRFNTLKANEEELNRIFIDIYGLQDELTPEVEDKDVTVRKADLQRDVKSLISYAVGCMFGRYSLDVEGLAYAGGNWSDQWSVVSGQYYPRKVVENCVRAELSRVDCLAEVDGFGGRGVSTGKTSAERGNVCTVRPDEKSSSFHSVQYCRGTGKKLYEGISELPVYCTGVESGTGNTAYDLCSPEILNAISSGSCDELVKRGWKDAERVDWKTVHCSLTTDHSFTPDKDNVIPICDDEYFEDDIVTRFVEFIRTVYGSDTLEENLKFIADALGGKGSPRQVIRNYFLNDFFKDHCKIYQKRPIYWLFDSGKKNGFKCLVYMHRYRRDTIARIRTDYVHEQQSRYRTAIDDLEQRITNAKTSERVKLSKELKKLTEQAEELRKYEELIHHLADQMIEIDLDDGVKVNYEKFKDVLGKIK